MASAILPCYRCGKVPTVDPNGGYPTVSCSDCYDGAPDSGSRGEVGSGLNTVQAVADWNERMEMEKPYETPRVSEQCWFGKTAGTRCASAGRWKRKPWPGCSQMLRDAIFCDTHRGREGQYRTCEHPMHDQDCPHGCDTPEEPHESPSLLAVGERLANADLERARRERAK